MGHYIKCGNNNTLFEDFPLVVNTEEPTDTVSVNVLEGTMENTTKSQDIKTYKNSMHTANIYTTLHKSLSTQQIYHER